MLKPIHEAEELDLSEGSLTTRQFIQTCIVCRGTTVVKVDTVKFWNWSDGAYVQDVWPNITPGQREVFISGIHDDCYDYLFPPEEDFNED